MSKLEIVKQINREQHRIKVALFDFDGTISTLRHGWESIMEPLMIEMISGPYPPDKEMIRKIRQYIDESTGTQTIFQMRWLVEQVTLSDRNPEIHDDWWYKDEYNRRLLEMVKNRTGKLLSGKCQPEDFRIMGSFEFIEALYQKGIDIYIASGTDDPDVKKEVGLLGIEQFVKEVSGAPFRKADCSKEAVIRNLIENHGIHGSEMLLFGDGKIEISLGARAGAVTIGTATDENRRYGINAIKREKLIRAGANAIIGDFLDFKDIFSWLRI
jgi:phosphoglycolate phosphatase-like HAD superfamily hydrolase